MPHLTPSERGLGVPEYEREEKDTQDGMKPSARPHQTPFVLLKPPSSVLNVVCVSAQNSPVRDFSPASASTRVTFVPQAREYYSTNQRTRHIGAQQKRQNACLCAIFAHMRVHDADERPRGTFAAPVCERLRVIFAQGVPGGAKGQLESIRVG